MQVKNHHTLDELNLVSPARGMVNTLGSLNYFFRRVSFFFFVYCWSPPSMEQNPRSNYFFAFFFWSVGKCVNKTFVFLH